MSLLHRARAHLGRRLEWRLLAVFLAAALIPLALSDWIATSVIAGIGQRLTHDRDSLATRAASRQVFDRLRLSSTLLRAVDEAQPLARSRLRASAIGVVAPFSELACADGGDTGYAALRRRWDEARSGSGMPIAARPPVILRLGARPNADDELLMGSTGEPSPHCIATLNPSYAWEPVLESADDSDWIVRADDGSRILARHGPDAIAYGDPSQPLDRFSAHLFLTSEFGAGNWTFEQSAPRPAIFWHGMPVVAWLLCVAVATLLLIGLVARRTIRKTLRPLEALTEGSRRLAAGIEPTRVDIRRNDELGRLASSFNEMAAQLEERIAALRALAQIDAGILGGAAFADLARGVLLRLATLRPQSCIVVAWRLDEGHLAAIRHPCTTARGVQGEIETLVLADDAAQVFEQLPDGACTPSSLAALGTALAGARATETSVPCLVLGVRDAGTNRALISLEDAGAGFDLQQAHDLRDRLAVAVVARRREDQLEHRATHDQLTGLRNAYGLQRALDPMLAGDDPVGVLFVDLDHFKDVNDCYGHAVGDRLLQAAARRLQRAAPSDALLSRNGGDEFVVILPHCDADQAVAAAARLLDALRQPFIIATTEHRSSASIGIALYPQHGLDRDDLLRCADIALYQSKNEGRGRATVFRPALDALLRERSDLLAGLDRALRRSEFVVHYQPRLDAATGAVVAAEALVRWQHPERGMTLPGVFIGLAESSGLIDALGLVVMEAAIVQMGEWQRQGLAIARVSVNVSQHQFASGTLVPDVRSLLQRHGVAGQRLEIEVTESVLGGDIDSVRRQLHELRELGAAIAMDDFGTGYSSLSQLRTLPIDVMKIDRAFVRDLESDPDAVAIARTIVTLARALGLHVVAEGIETQAQAALLAAMGCDQFQGFLYSQAVPAHECAALGRFDMPVVAS
jgi:diguanylate cyclase (GGDEF)-like protein